MIWANYSISKTRFVFRQLCLRWMSWGLEPEFKPTSQDGTIVNVLRSWSTKAFTGWLYVCHISVAACRNTEHCRRYVHDRQFENRRSQWERRQKLGDKFSLQLLFLESSNSPSLRIDENKMDLFSFFVSNVADINYLKHFVTTQGTSVLCFNA